MRKYLESLAKSLRHTHEVWQKSNPMDQTAINAHADALMAYSNIFINLPGDQIRRTDIETILEVLPVKILARHEKLPNTLAGNVLSAREAWQRSQKPPVSQQLGTQKIESLKMLVACETILATIQEVAHLTHRPMRVVPGTMLLSETRLLIHGHQLDKLQGAARDTHKNAWDARRAQIITDLAL